MQVRPAGASAPPDPPPKDAIRAREELIKAKKRDARRKDELASLGYSTPSAVQTKNAGRPNRRRSMSTGDAEDLLTRTPAAQRRTAALRSEGLLDVLPIEQEDDPLTDSIQRELLKLEGPARSVRVRGLLRRSAVADPRGCGQKYHVRQHEETIYASSDAEQISHVGDAGDIDGGKAWRTVKRPSDMVRFSQRAI